MSAVQEQQLRSKCVEQSQLNWEDPQDPFSQRVKDKMSKKKAISIIGVCSMHSKEQVLDIAEYLDDADAMRGPTKKPRTDEMDENDQLIFAGVGNKAGREIYTALLEKHPKMLIASEVMTGEDIRELAPLLSLGWVGARTTNHDHLRGIGREAQAANLPIAVKNPLVKDIKAYLAMIKDVAYGSQSAIPLLLCLRGTYPHEAESALWRNVPNFDWIRILKECFPALPILIDSGHERWPKDVTVANELAHIEEGLAAGADGFIAEVHHPDHPSRTDKGVPVDVFMNELARRNIV